MTAETVKVLVLHSRSYPGTKWVAPVGWTPRTDWANGEWDYIDGSLWSRHEEEAGLSAVTDAAEGNHIEVPVSDVFWSTTGDCRYLRPCKIAE